MFYICTRKYDLLTKIFLIMGKHVKKQKLHCFLVKVLSYGDNDFTFKVVLAGSECEYLSNLMCISRGCLYYVNGCRVSVFDPDGIELFTFVR